MTDNNFGKPSNSKKQNLHPLILALVLAGGILLGYMVSINTVEKPSILQKYNYNKIEDVIKYIDNNYVDSLNVKDLENKAIENLLSDLDPHSVYIPSSEMQAVEEDMQGNFEGIGVEFRIRKDTISIEATIQDGPSEKIGIVAGDKIIYVEDSLVAGVGVKNSDVVKMLKGPKGTKVKVTMLRQGDLIPFYIVRDKIPIYSVDASYLLNKETGYIKVNRFAATTYDEFSSSLKKLKKQEIKNLIIDLRGNPGGYLQAAVEMIDEILTDDKLVVYTEGLHQPRVDYLTDSKGLFEEGKLVVLVDQFSASASEIMAGAIQDWDRGTIIGRRTFGKGLVQEQHLFPDTSALRLTVARYYTPSGRSIQKPYDDKDSYYQELGNRFEDGELLGTDSLAETHQDTVVYYTKVEKRKVYGGGGIAPDVFVPLDTLMTNNYVASFRQYMAPFLFDYTTKNKAEFDKYNVDNFVGNFQVSNEMLLSFISYAQSNGFERKLSDNTNYKRGIKVLLKANLAKQLFKNEGFYRVVNSESEAIKKALEEFAN